ncbi:MAG TPA: hypothetical protein PLZ57_02370 [Pseudobdellovibrionaceae bacterium]|nr:hypothetical protein [Pseudobdellovibrionaceae bacterium]
MDTRNWGTAMKRAFGGVLLLSGIASVGANAQSQEIEIRGRAAFSLEPERFVVEGEQEIWRIARESLPHEIATSLEHAMIERSEVKLNVPTASVLNRWPSWRRGEREGVGPPAELMKAEGFHANVSDEMGVVELLGRLGASFSESEVLIEASGCLYRIHAESLSADQAKQVRQKVAGEKVQVKAAARDFVWLGRFAIESGETSGEARRGRRAWLATKGVWAIEAWLEASLDERLVLLRLESEYLQLAPRDANAWAKRRVGDWVEYEAKPEEIRFAWQVATMSEFRDANDPQLVPVISAPSLR